MQTCPDLRFPRQMSATWYITDWFRMYRDAYPEAGYDEALRALDDRHPGDLRFHDPRVVFACWTLAGGPA